jgi:DNA-directed RNA polymerase subunit RPC12/RpoP
MVAESRPGVETREVVCTHCDRPIEIPATAMSVNCRHCHRRVIIEDLKIKTYHAVVRLATAGRVEVARKGTVVAAVRVRDLEVDGQVKGNVTALGHVAVTKRGTILGDVSCKSLQVQPGARLEGRFVVDPDYRPEPAANGADGDDDDD